MNEDTSFHEPLPHPRRAGHWSDQRAETPDERRERTANALDPVLPRTRCERCLSALAWFGTPAFTLAAVVVAFACGYGTCRFLC
jgi:hypothetical protein